MSCCAFVMLARLDVLYCPLPIITGLAFHLLDQDGVGLHCTEPDMRRHFMTRAYGGMRHNSL